jgi:hypothetical protein
MKTDLNRQDAKRAKEEQGMELAAFVLDNRQSSVVCNNFNSVSWRSLRLGG